MEVDGQVHTAEQLRFSRGKSLATTEGENPSHVKVNINKCKRECTRKMWLNKHLDEKEVEEKQGESDMHIYKAPSLFRESDLFKPQEVFLGPYHWSNNSKDLLRRKRSMAERLFPDEMILKEVQDKVFGNMEKLMKAFCTEETNLDELDWWEMLFLDGCFVLHFIFCVMYNRVEDLGIERCKVASVHNDLFMLENQLPYELLKIISGDDPKLHRLIYEYICTHKLSNYHGRVLDLEANPPVHLLDCLRRIIIGRRSEPKKRILRRCMTTCNNCMSHAIRCIWRRLLQESSSMDEKESSTDEMCAVLRHAKELTTRGIHLKPNRSGFLKDISFTSHFIYGTLKLPRITVDDSTKLLFLNMAAYEMCVGEESAIISYICFLDSLVNHAEDIKELQTSGILVNKLPTDEDAAKLFNEMSARLRPDPDTYLDVKRKMNRFFENTTKANLSSWIAEGYHNHFRSPLTAMAVLAAFIALCLAAIQTYFTVFH